MRDRVSKEGIFTLNPVFYLLNPQWGVGDMVLISNGNSVYVAHL